MIVTFAWISVLINFIIRLIKPTSKYDIVNHFFSQRLLSSMSISIKYSYIFLSYFSLYSFLLLTMHLMSLLFRIPWIIPEINMLADDWQFSGIHAKYIDTSSLAKKSLTQLRKRLLSFLQCYKCWYREKAHN